MCRSNRRGCTVIPNGSLAYGSTEWYLNTSGVRDRPASLVSTAMADHPTWGIANGNPVTIEITVVFAVELRSEEW
jgi:hypothetical protein